ncbi:hypothetical protein MGN01_41260 [Methylobacterium gnaphalii]|uniref:Uncharacterized protein n=2 Tax=Methylobacterium gnaphalii TaxID=1010610 RepID=A0A512JQS0_9HYPH|nr:hypothetical protein MGN01_41260 [Methylobacterium gnaphalii]
MMPGQVRAALVSHLARKFGWTGRTVEHTLASLSNKEIVDCLQLDVEGAKAAIFARAARALQEAC